MEHDDSVMVSVIIITYNHEKYISRAIEGVLNQKTNFKYEILIGDDASSDETCKIISEYTQKYPDLINFYPRTENVGATKNDYNLMKKAKGKYLANCEGDDFWTDENKLQLQVDFLEAHEQYIGCCHNIIVVNQNEHLLKKYNIRWISNKSSFSIKDFKGIFLPGHPVSIVRRNLFLNADFDGSLYYKAHKMIGDRTGILLWLAHGDFYKLDNNMAAYRISDGNSENLTSQLYKKNSNRISDDFEYTLKLNNYAKKHIKQKINFDYHKRQLWISSIYSLIFHHISDQKLPGRIFKSIENKPIAIILFLPTILKKIIQKLRK